MSIPAICDEGGAPAPHAWTEQLDSGEAVTAYGCATHAPDDVVAHDLSLEQTLEDSP